MESEAAAVLGYVNRPTGQVLRPRVHPGAAGSETGHRSGLRVALVALRAYEQRTERRAAMRAWLRARAATAACAGYHPPVNRIPADW